MSRRRSEPCVSFFGLVPVTLHAWIAACPLLAPHPQSGSTRTVIVLYTWRVVGILETQITVPCRVVPLFIPSR